MLSLPEQLMALYREELVALWRPVIIPRLPYKEPAYRIYQRPPTGWQPRTPPPVEYVLPIVCDPYTPKPLGWSWHPYRLTCLLTTESS